MLQIMHVKWIDSKFLTGAESRIPIVRFASARSRVLKSRFHASISAKCHSQPGRLHVLYVTSRHSFRQPCHICPGK